MRDLVIWGVGPFAKLMRYYFEHDSVYRVVAFTADERFIAEPTFLGLPLLPVELVAERFPPDCVGMFVAIGYRSMRNRRVLFDRAKAMSYSLVNYIGSGATRYPDLEIGENNVAMEGVIFEPFARVGDNNVFWSGTLVCHDAEIGHHSYVAARALIGGGCVVGDGCFVGNGAVLIDHVNLALETHVAPGAVVMRDTVEHRKYAGNPAREIGSHEERGIVIERA